MRLPRRGGAPGGGGGGREGKSKEEQRNEAGNQTCRGGKRQHNFHAHRLATVDLQPFLEGLVAGQVQHPWPHIDSLGGRGWRGGAAPPPRPPPAPRDPREAPEASLGVASSSRRVQWLRRAVPPARGRAAHPSRQTRTPSVRSTGPARRWAAAARPPPPPPPPPHSRRPPAGQCAGRRGRPAPPG